MWLWLAVAITTEVTATLALRASDGFSQLIPSAVVVTGYGFAFFALSQAMVRGMEVGMAYAIWAGVGVAIVSTAGVFLFGDQLSPVQVFGIGLVVAGVAALRLGVVR